MNLNKYDTFYIVFKYLFDTSLLLEEKYVPFRILPNGRNGNLRGFPTF